MLLSTLLAQLPLFQNQNNRLMLQLPQKSLMLMHRFESLSCCLFIRNSLDLTPQSLLVIEWSNLRWMMGCCGRSWHFSLKQQSTKEEKDEFAALDRHAWQSLSSSLEAWSSSDEASEEILISTDDDEAYSSWDECSSTSSEPTPRLERFVDVPELVRFVDRELKRSRRAEARSAAIKTQGRWGGWAEFVREKGQAFSSLLVSFLGALRCVRRLTPPLPQQKSQ